MPFKSKAQQGFMFAKHPEMAKEWAEKTPNISKLPEHVKKMADGGEAGVDERSPDYPTSAMTGSDIPMGLMALLGMPEAASAASEVPAALEGLGEAGEISLGGAAPEMEGMAPKVEVYSKGMMGKGTPNEMTIWGVKGDPEEIAKLGYGTDPGSVPEHILKQHGLLPDMKIDASSMPSPNEYAKGGEVKKVHDMKDLHKLTALKGIAHGSVDQSPPMNYADGGDVSPMGDLSQIAQLSGMVPPTAPPQAIPQVAPQAPNPIMQASQTAQATPPTPPSIYQGISADQRAALLQQLLAQKASGGNMAASGIAGLGDAVSNAFGKGGQNAQGAVREAQAKNVQNQIGAVDTQREQRMQDVQGNLEQQSNDPASSLSKSMQATFKAAGINVPSGMPASMMMKIAPALGELAMKQATMEMTKQNNLANQDLRKNQQDLAEQEFNANHWIRNIVGGGVKAGAQPTTQATPSPMGWAPDKEAKYQAWKASQGK